MLHRADDKVVALTAGLTNATKKCDPMSGELADMASKNRDLALRVLILSRGAARRHRGQAHREGRGARPPERGDGCPRRAPRERDKAARHRDDEAWRGENPEQRPGPAS